MTPAEEMAAALQALGLTQRELAERLLLGKGGQRTVRRWLAGDTKRAGPALVAIRYMLAEHRREIEEGRR